MVVINDPKAASQGLLSKQCRDLIHHPNERRDHLHQRAKHDDSGVILRRKTANVREVEVQSDKRPLLHLAHSGNCRVSKARQPLFGNGHRIVALLLKQFGNFEGEIFIGFESHHTASRSVTMRPFDNSAA